MSLPDSPQFSLNRNLLLALALVGCTTAAFATSYVLMSDESLVDSTSFIVYGTIEAVDSAPGEAATHARLRVSESLKGGRAIGEQLRVRVPGGTAPNGMRLHVYGAPQFVVGEEVLLFLNERDDGNFGIHQLMMGSFHRVGTSTEAVGVRYLSEASRLGTEPGAQEGPRDLVAFKSWITDRIAGLEREADYFAASSDSSGPQNHSEPFRFIINNPAARYNEFDSGGSVPWRLNSNGSALTANILNAGRNPWNNENQTQVNYTYGGTSSATGGLTTFDSLNVMMGGDPNNEAEGSFSCISGGVIAVGGPWFDPDVLITFNGITWIKIFGGDVVFNDGTDCFFSGSAGVVRANEVAAHEFGHTLGLGHSCGDPGSGACNTSAKDDATMRANVHDDGRGGSIRSDDRNGLRALYAPAGGGGSTPNAPSGLIAAAISPTQALLSYLDNSIDETGFRVEISNGSGFSTLVDGPADLSELTVGGLTPGSMPTFRVRALGGNNSSPSNEASTSQPAIVGGCTPSGSVLCLNDGRFHVSASFIAFQDSGVAQAVELTPDTGYFWFFNQNNVELVVKVLNACAVPFEKYWVFAGGLTNVQVTLTVVDTQNGTTRAYFNPLETVFSPITDTNAFATCP